LSFVGIVVIPGIVAFLFASLPFLDRRMERRPWKRPIAVGTYVFVFLALFGLGYTSYHSDHSNPGYATQLAIQQKETEAYMSKPFEPEVVRRSSASPAVPANPLVAQGAQLYQAQSCSACHGEAGGGTAAAASLIGIHQHLSAEQLSALLKSPSAKMVAGGMAPIDLPSDKMEALVAYLESL
jgi:mono/diheme cytochrome c family protein